tara:strand:- start:114 stop:953 length:840 start_codon:yes stop_codon:yes gene_type:complete
MALRAEVERSIDSARGDLKAALEEYSGFFICPDDRRYIDHLSDLVESHMESTSAAVNHRGGYLEIFRFGGRLHVLDRLLLHADYFKKSGVVRYKVGVDFLDNSEMLTFLEGKKSSNFIPDYLFNAFSKFRGQILKKDNLSAEQVILSEKCSVEIALSERLEREGVVYLSSSSTACLKDYPFKTVNFILSGKKLSTRPSGEDFLKVRDMFLGKGPVEDEVDLSSVRSQLVVDDGSVARMYNKACDALERYLNRINREDYDVESLIATPKSAALQKGVAGF